MLTLSRWIIGYGAALIVLDGVDSASSLHLGFHGRSLICGWIGGIILVASGLAADQRRRSLRMGGLYVAVALAIALAGFFAWDATEGWKSLAGGGNSMAQAIMPTVWTILTISLLAVITRLRPREGIASRGYAVPLPPKPPARPKVEPVAQERRSSAG